MSADFHQIEAEIRYLTTQEGGRRTGVFSGYRGQFYYGGNDYDGFQFFPDLSDDEMVELGTTVRAVVRFLQERWDEVHSKLFAWHPRQIAGLQVLKPSSPVCKMTLSTCRMQKTVASC